MMLALKRIDESARMLASAGAAWRHQGWDAALETPPPGGVWLPLADADRHWQGWLRLQDWLENVSPDLAGLAISAGVDAQVVQWLAAVEQPVKLPMPELAYQRLWLGEPVTRNALPPRPLLRVMGESGPLWLEQVPEVDAGELIAPAGLSWPLRFVIGESRIGLALLNRVSRGDLLLIGARVSEVRCYRKTLGPFQQLDEGIHMEYQCIDESQDLSDVQEVVEVVRDMGRLPVQLEFVLHNYRLTLAELQSMCRGQLLSLPAGAELNVEIRGNGAILGYGELVQLDEQLGVEVNQWLGECRNDE
ncbi:YscQ/HrcQ family type III secretion apparatus protein [Serratia proteamaculans]|nr:YscQ/HrcQ family type III secretion apparatus protein [Serratia proteamaculans]